jgi:hypothetical protein
VTESLYFESPEQAVAITSQLLRDEQFERLSRYYDLTGTGIDRAQLASGDFFVRRERPEAAHPGGFWKYREPFAPGFAYESHSVDDDIATVRVTIAIDQGDGMIQRGESSFRMRKGDRGWQLLPVGDVQSEPAHQAEPSPAPPWEETEP